MKHKNVNYYTHKIDTILGTLCTATVDFIICGDININYLIDSARKNQLDTLLCSYNLSDIIKFPILEFRKKNCQCKR